MAQVGKISANLESYLETIFDLVKEFGLAKISDLAKRKRVKKASANEAVARLIKAGLVRHDHYSDISLTRSGVSLADKLTQRHALIKRFLEEVIEVPSHIAEQDACIIEHLVHEETVGGVVRFFQLMDSSQKDIH